MSLSHLSCSRNPHPRIGWGEFKDLFLKSCLPGFTCFARALVLVIHRCRVGTTATPCFFAAATTTGVIRPFAPGTLDHASRVFLLVCQVRCSTVRFLFLLPLTTFSTICWCWFVTVATFDLFAGRLSISAVAAGAPGAPGSPVAVHCWIGWLHLHPQDFFKI